jgi:hypothetical protein
MLVRAIVVVALLTVAVPIAAQDQPVPAAPAIAAVGTIGSSISTISVKPVRFSIAPDWTRPSSAARRASFATSAVQSAVPRKRSKAPIVGGMLAGAVLGFFGGDYLQHSFCEYDCPPGGFTWGFTAIGAGAGAAVGWLIWR